MQYTCKESSSDCNIHVRRVLAFWILTYILTLLQYNSKDSSVRLAYEPQPRPKAIASLSGETIVKVACGTNHTGSYDAFCLCALSFSLSPTCCMWLFMLLYLHLFWASSGGGFKWPCLHVSILLLIEFHVAFCLFTFMFFIMDLFIYLQFINFLLV